ncbi:hypothetical protein M409DRAFT_50380 [Zasmidium cellare ATCC 36951]|uniref:Zn(2)-C6 fungal-type domain-containing protein n=1 Tax=Zasmidium cellare ATCC 36951 TaxID=1080233 RepID=A0A6A6D0N5_ZASCE|nr:uncharacterized protein M409DRAFT_50380 [Zasmidium cellare ATCC 36951]KAF2171722.1 hypothetical protein M409DRAFT_50380 [Zasmidium cellare ATCC 36951]
MSAVRLSFGSRAGGTGDYQQNTTNGFFSGGPYDSLEALADALKNEIRGSAESTVPECTTVELSLAYTALIPLVRPTIGPYADGQANDLPQEFKTNMQDVDNGSGTSKAEPVATAGLVINIADPAQRAIVQRAASRGLISTIEAADGFKYCFNNAWAAKDEEGSRFSYICQDSMQNKDRHANGFTRTLKHLKGEGERGPRKPTYDCKGSVSVKFSSGRQSVDVYYRHYAIHATVAERKAAPRPPPKPRTPGEQNSRPKETGGLLATLQAENVASSALAAMEPAQPSNIGRPLKRKRDSGGPPIVQSKDWNQGMSLMDLLRQSDTANAPQPPPEAAKPARQPAKAPVAYELPSWQSPPPPLNHPGPTSGYPAPYPPPQSRNKPTSTPTPQQRKSSAQRPQAQGLFTTMKPATWTNKSAEQVSYGPISTQPSPVVFKPPQTTTSTRFTNRDAHVPRAIRSCNNCRLRKLKCDEGRPCSTCIKSNKTDCDYVPNPSASTSSSTPVPTPAQSAQPAPPAQPRAPQPPPKAIQPARPDFAASSSSWGDLSQHSGPISWQTQSESLGPSQQWQPPQSGDLAAGTMAYGKSQNQGQREESPDPWFPKR